MAVGVLFSTNRFEVFTAMKIQLEVFWVVTPCSVVLGKQRFRGPCRLHLQDEDGGGMVPRNVGTLSQHYMKSQLRRSRFEFSVHKGIIIPEKTQIYTLQFLYGMMESGMRNPLHSYQCVNKTRIINSANTKVRYWAQSWASSIQLSSSQPIYDHKLNLNIFIPSPSCVSKWPIYSPKLCKHFLSPSIELYNQPILTLLISLS
jgi:hypothetical protein